MATLIDDPAPAYRLRPARGNEIGELQNIDLASAMLFRGSGLIDFGPLGEPATTKGYTLVALSRLKTDETK